MGFCGTKIGHVDSRGVPRNLKRGGPAIFDVQFTARNQVKTKKEKGLSGRGATPAAPPGYAPGQGNNYLSMGYIKYL